MAGALYFYGSDIMKTKKLVIAALFAAITCMATLVQIPMPLIGYINLGDCFVLLGAWILGPVYGAAAAGIGSLLGDVISGYAAYAPFTFIIKASMAVVAYYIVGKAKRLSPCIIRRILAAILAEIVMISGYFLTECFVFRLGLGAAASIPYNCIQGAVGLIAAVLLFITVGRIKIFKEL